MPTVPSPPSTRCWSCGSRTLTRSRRPGGARESPCSVASTRWQTRSGPAACSPRSCASSGRMTSRLQSAGRRRHKARLLGEQAARDQVRELLRDVVRRVGASGPVPEVDHVDEAEEAVDDDRVGGSKRAGPHALLDDLPPDALDLVAQRLELHPAAGAQSIAITNINHNGQPVRGDRLNVIVDKTPQLLNKFEV